MGSRKEGKMKDQQRIFSENLQRLLAEKDMTQYRLAEYLGLSKGAISKWCSGNGMPRMSKIEEIANVLNVDKSELLDDVTDTFIKKNAIPLGKNRLPVIATVAAGYPTYTEENIVEYIDYDKSTDGKFAVYIHGNSMQPRILDGDLIIVDKNAIYSDGDIVIATVNGEDGTCKRFRAYKDGVSLVPINPEYEPLFFSKEEVDTLPVRIVGRVIEIRSKL